MTQSVLDLYLKETKEEPMGEPLELFVDGYTIGRNPSKIGGGFSIFDKQDNLLEEVEVKKYWMTNNEAELLGMTRALELATTNSIIYTDSRNTMAWVKSGRPKARMDLQPIALKARRLIEEKNITVCWVPREMNLAGIYLENRGL